ncbi:DUF6119 family protein [Oceanobacillus sp. CAU 1775]
MDESLPLSVYLIKAEFKEYDQILKNMDEITDTLEIKSTLNLDGKAFIGDNKQNPPKWDGFLDNILKDYSTQLNQSTRAVLFIKRKKRIFAFTFGYGRHLLKDDVYERNFGFKVILNNAKRDSIKSIDSSVIDEKTFQNRSQAPRASRMEDFNLTDIRTMFRSITAESKLEDRYGHTITGKDNFNFNNKFGLTNLNYLCEILLDDFQNKTYLDKFPEIDRIKEISDPTMIDRLNVLMINKFMKNENIYLMIPDIIDWTEVEGFSYTAAGTIYPSPSIDDFWKNKSKIYNGKLTVEKLKNHYLYQRMNDDIVEKWSIIKCIFTEIEYEGHHYIFYNGLWFEIKKELIEKVNHFITELPLCEIEFPIIHGYHEKNANIIFANENSNLLNMDRNNMRIDDSKYEVCDLLTKDSKLIHVKWWDSSATLSHLFSQGKVSGEILANDNTQRIEINKNIEELNPDFVNIIKNDDFSPEDYTIVFAIIYEGEKTFTERLPFFSKINLMQATKELRSMRYNVEIVHIESSCNRLSTEENTKAIAEYEHAATL